MSYESMVPRFILDSDVVPLCAESDPDAFFPKDYYDDPGKTTASNDYVNERFVKSICEECPLKIECLQFAVKTVQHGIWGGTTESERRAIRRGRSVKLQRRLGLAPIASSKSR
jgi:WhiB family redox-sensing transcriptional regulator